MPTQETLAGKIVRENQSIEFSLGQIFGAIRVSYARCESVVRDYIIDLGYQVYLTARHDIEADAGDFISTLGGPIAIEYSTIKEIAEGFFTFIDSDMEGLRNDTFFVIGYLEILKRLNTETGEVEYNDISTLDRTIDVTSTFLARCMDIYEETERVKLL